MINGLRTDSPKLLMIQFLLTGLLIFFLMNLDLLVPDTGVAKYLVAKLLAWVHCKKFRGV
jgi:hypothetical protein